MGYPTQDSITIVPCRECKMPFVQTRSNHSFCCHVCGCRWRQSVRSHKYNAQRKARYRRDHEMLLAKQKVYYQNNREVMAKRGREYHARNREARLAYLRAWHRRNPDSCHLKNIRRRAQKLGVDVAVTLSHDEWIIIQQVYGYTCAYCGCTPRRGLTQDHVIPLCKGGSHTVDNVVPACQHCNNVKATKDVETFFAEMQAR